MIRGPAAFLGADGTTTDPIVAPLLQLGVAGIFLLTLLWFSRLMLAKRDTAIDQMRESWAQERADLIAARDKALENRDRTANDLKEFQELMQTRTMATLDAAHRSVAETLTQQRALVDKLDQSQAEITLLRRQISAMG